MDLPDSLKRLTRILLKPSEEVDVALRAPSTNTLNRWLVSLACSIDGRVLHSSGTSKYCMEAYAKALGEISECSLMHSQQLESRCGIASGLFRSQARIRAQGELIERDAFFHHYRCRIPFLSSNRISPAGTDLPELLAFEMSSADSAFTAVLVTDAPTASGETRCLTFGTAAHPDPRIALEKATQEFAAIYLNHRLHPERCEKWEASASEVPTIMDFHHVASRDQRNILRFRDLCASASKSQRMSRLDQSRWELKDLSSPVRGYAYIRASHPDLTPMTFGTPEPDSSPENPLYHPFW